MTFKSILLTLLLCGTAHVAMATTAPIMLDWTHDGQFNAEFCLTSPVDLYGWQVALQFDVPVSGLQIWKANIVNSTADGTLFIVENKNWNQKWLADEEERCFRMRAVMDDDLSMEEDEPIGNAEILGVGDGDDEEECDLKGSIQGLEVEITAHWAGGIQAEVCLLAPKKLKNWKILLTFDEKIPGDIEIFNAKEIRTKKGKEVIVRPFNKYSKKLEMGSRFCFQFKANTNGKMMMPCIDAYFAQGKNPMEPQFTTTTAAPSTAAPSTAAPSTPAPSTAAPSTAAPSTAAPSTAAPSTAAPSTAAPSTAAPSTAAPSTAAPSTAAPEAPPVDNQQDAFTEEQKQEILLRHNQLRSGEGATDMTKMTWDPTLADLAQTFADRCEFAHSSDADRSNGDFSYIGENIYVNTGSFNAWGVVQSWFDEKSDYDFDTQTCQPNRMCGHYTQVVWAGSSALGCAVSFCENGITGWNDRSGNPHVGYTVFCNYGPGGNYRGQDPFTKGAPCSECPSSMDTCEVNLCTTA